MIAIYSLAALLAVQLAAARPAPSSAALSSTEDPGGSAPLPAPSSAPKNSAWPGATHAFEALAKEAERAAETRSPLALGLIYRMWNGNSLVERPARAKQSLEAIAATRHLDPLVRAHAQHLLSQVLELEGKLDQSRALVSKIGLVTSAFLIGPFENSAGQGHDEPFPPETAIELDRALEGKAHAVRWHQIEGLAPHGVFELSQLVYPSSEATAYVMVALEAKRPSQAALRIGSVDQLKVFLNQEPIHALDTRRYANLDQDAIGLSIPEGKSLLVLKSSWTGAFGRLMFRLTAPDGSPLDGVLVQSDPGSIRAASARPKGKKPAAAVRVESPTDAIDRAIKRARGSELADALAVRADLVAVLGLFDRRKLPTPPEKDLEAAIRLAPSNPMMRFFYAHRAQERDPTLAREQLEAALVADPNHVPSLFKLAEMARGAGRVVEAEQRLVQAIHKDPDFAPAHLSLAALRFESSADRELALVDLTAFTQRVASPSVLAELARMERTLEDRPRAKADAERALALDFTNGGARALLINLALDANRIEEAIGHIDRAIQLAPWQLDHRLRKARVLAGVPKRLDDAMAVLVDAEKAFPNNPEAPNLLSELMLFQGDRDNAQRELERSLAGDPQQPDVRRHLGTIAGVKRELEDEYAVEAKTLLHSPITPDEATWGAIYLAERTAIRLYENGQSSRFQQTVLRLRNANLKDAVRVHRIGYAPGREVVEILAAERLRPTGEVLKASNISDDAPRGKVSGMYLDRRFKTIVFDDMAAGDVVDIRYRVDSLGQNIFGSFFGDIEGLQGPLPKLGMMYSVIAPKSRPLYYGQVHARAPVSGEVDGASKLTWAYERLDALDLEPYAPPYPELGAMVSVSTYKTWSDLGRWYASLFSEQLELDTSAREAGKSAIRGAKTTQEKITRLYDYVVKNTRYVGIELGIHGWKPFKASEVHRRRYGDCKDKATLLAALLRDNGIDAAVTLVRTSDRGLLPEDHATMWAFNHAITYVPSENLFLDGTAEFSGSHELPYLDQGAMALIVHPDATTRLTTLPETKAEENLNSSSYTATLKRDGALELEGKEDFYGARASPMRQEFEEAEQRKTRLEKQLNQTFNGVHVRELSFSDLSNLEIPVEYRYKASIERYGVEESGRYIIPVALFQHQVASAYGALATRKTDLYSNHPWATRNVVRYRLPPGATIELLPEGVSIDTSHVALAQTVKVVPGGFETDDTVTLKTRRVPAAEYAEFRRACLAIDRALARRVVIRW